MRGGKESFPVATAEEAGFSDYAFRKRFSVDRNRQIHVLITGAGSYIGKSFQKYCADHYPNIETTAISLRDGSWKSTHFNSYDTVFHVAGIAHADVGNVSEEEKKAYYAVNTDLAIEVARKAKEAGVKQFVLMSSMIVYGDAERIDENTLPHPANFYGDSKWQADKGVRALADDTFKTAVLRAPMIYGKDSKGNYRTLSKIAQKTPIIPDYPNKRSMLHIDNLCEFLVLLMLSGEGGIFFPQNGGYTKTASLVRAIGKVHGKKVRTTHLFNPAVAVSLHTPGKVGSLAKKAFGNSYYVSKLSHYQGLQYQIIGGAESVKRTEDRSVNTDVNNDTRRHILVVSQYFYPEPFRVNDLAKAWADRGYRVTVLTGIPNYPMGKFYEGYDLKHKRRETIDGVEIIRIPLIPRGNSKNKLINAIGMSANYLSFVFSGRQWVKKHNIGADLVFTVEVSPMTQALVGCWYAKRYQVPHFLYVQDLWPENVETVTGIRHPVVIRPIEKMVDYIYRNTDQIFTTSPSFVQEIIGRGVAGKKVHYWPQYAEACYRPENRKTVREEADENSPVHLIPDDDSFKIIFTGNIGTAQGLDILPKTARLIKESAKHDDKPIRFVIVGDGRYQEQFTDEIKSNNVEDMFTLIPQQNKEEIPKLLACCDAAFVSFQDNALWNKTIPAKLQSYMACGMPVIASAQGETERIIAEADCGLYCKTGDVNGLKEVIYKFITMSDENRTKMGQNASCYAKEHFNQETLLADMGRYTETALASRKAA